MRVGWDGWPVGWALRFADVVPLRSRRPVRATVPSWWMALRKDSWPASLKELRLSADKGNECMAVNVDSKIRKLSTAQRKKVEVRATELISEEMTRRELRKSRKLTRS